MFGSEATVSRCYLSLSNSFRAMGNSLDGKIIPMGLYTCEVIRYHITRGMSTYFACRMTYLLLHKHDYPEVVGPYCE